MAKEETSPKYGVWLVMVCSLSLNLMFIIANHQQQQQQHDSGWKLKLLSWSSKAAAEAEAVAAISCSGHGRAYLDGVVVDGQQACECNACYAASDCSLFLPDGCDAEADSGDPYFLEPFWMQHAASSAVLVAGWHRMSYTYSNNRSFISLELDRRIRKLHSIVGNAVTDGRYIVFGAGSTQLLNAAVHALSPDNCSMPARVVASVPFYGLYKQQTEYLESVDYKFQGDTALWMNSSDTETRTVEFVTSPNNPDGLPNKAVLHGPFAKAIYDHAYYWPHFTGIPAPSDEDVMIFTISKLTGHAGSRFGWAVIKDEAVYERMYMHMSVNTMGVARDTQIRALRLLDVVLKSNGTEIFEFGYKTMANRWEKLRKTMSISKRFSLQHIPPEQCTFFRRVREATPAYAWLRCEREEDTNCYKVLKAANINGREGTVFGAESHYVRLSIIRSQDDFDLLLQRLNKLVSHEDGAKPM